MLIKIINTEYRFAFKFNPALQPRSIVVLGCISKEADDIVVQQVLQVLIIVSTLNNLKVRGVIFFINCSEVVVLLVIFKME